MSLISCSPVVRLCLFALITVGLAAPAAAQSITVISPHEGEQVRSYNYYMVRWDASGIPADGSFYLYTLSDWDGAAQLICTAPASARACEWSEPYASERGTLFIQGRDGSGTPLVTVESGRFHTVVNTLPVPLNHFDVGAVARSGHSWADLDGTVRVRGSGADIWGTADAFQFAYMENYWDMNARVTLTGIEGTHPWTKAGLMVRESFHPGAVHHYVLVSKDRGVAYQRRVTPGGESLHSSLSASSALPVTIEMMRRGGYVEMNVRRGDGPWERAAGFDVESYRLVGLAVTSHDNAVLADGVFTDVQFEYMADEKVYIYSPQPREVIAAGVPYTISWTHNQPVNVATVSLSVDGGATWSGRLDGPKVRRYLTAMRTTVSSKGQIVLPAELRQLDRIEAGQEFDIERIGPGEYRVVRRRASNEGVVDWLLACPAKGFFVPIESESTDSL